MNFGEWLYKQSFTHRGWWDHVMWRCTQFCCFCEKQVSSDEELASHLYNVHRERQ